MAKAHGARQAPEGSRAKTYVERLMRFPVDFYYSGVWSLTSRTLTQKRTQMDQ